MSSEEASEKRTKDGQKRWRRQDSPNQEIEVWAAILSIPRLSLFYLSLLSIPLFLDLI